MLVFTFFLFCKSSSNPVYGFSGTSSHYLKKFTEGDPSVPLGIYKQTPNDYPSDSAAMINGVATAIDTVITNTKQSAKSKNKKERTKPAMQKGQAIRRKKQ